jgi:hypothetical protein
VEHQVHLELREHQGHREVVEHQVHLVLREHRGQVELDLVQ